MSDSRRTGLTLVLGPANSGKMGHVLAWWRERLPQNPVVVVPTAPDALEFSLEMAGRTGCLVGQSRALTFDGLVRLVVGRSPRYTADVERDLVLTRVLGETPLEALRVAVRFPGAVVALGRLLLQLAESGRDADELDRILALWATAEPDVAPLARDVRRLARAYDRACADTGLEVRPAVVREAARAAADWTRPLALYGFTSFTPGQRKLVVELSRRTEVLLTFTNDRSRAVNLSTPAEISWWEARAAEVVEVSSRTRAYDSAAIAFLERRFMSDDVLPEPPPVSSGASGVRFLLASGRRAEAELAAEQIVGLLREGHRPEDIAVVVRQVHSWSDLLGQVFDSCGIPYQIDDRRSLRETGIGHAFLSVLRGVALDDANGILAYLRSPYSEISFDAASALELRYRRGAGKGSQPLAALARSMGLGSVERLWEIVDEGCGPQGSAGQDPAGKVAAGSGDESPCLGATRVDVAAATGLARRMLAAGLRGSASGDRDLEDDARAYVALRGALETIARLVSLGDGVRAGEGGGPGTGCPAGFDARALMRALPQVAVSEGRSDMTGAVRVLSVQRARARRFPVVVMLGLVEGEFPGRPDTPSLLSPAHRAQLDAIGEGLFAPEADQEAALFVSAISRASNLLFLSARDAEDDGSEAVPSHFWESSRRLLAAADDERIVRTLAEQVFRPEAAPSPLHYLRGCAAWGLAPNPAVVAVAGCAAPRLWSRAPWRLTDPGVLAELDATDCFSPSALEAYAACPFAWFVERVIGAEEMDLEMDGRQLGQLLHSALGTIYLRLASAGLAPLRPESMAAAECVAAAVIDEIVGSSDGPGTASERRLAVWKLTRMTRNLFEMEISAAADLTFAEPESWVGGPRGVDVGGLRVRGRVDRVDVTPERQGLFVLDYKSGAIPAASAIGTVDGLQLPLYLMALKVERPQMEVLGGAYLGLLDKKRSGVIAASSQDVLGSGRDGCRALDGAGLEELFQNTREVAQEAANGMRAGVIAPRSDRRCAPWCKLGPACRARRGGYKP